MIRKKGDSSYRPTRPTVGWREWVALPDLDVAAVKCKIDTGARTSSVHAFDIEEFKRGGRVWVRFRLHPEQRSARGEREVELPVKDRRIVRPSTGRGETRYVVETQIQLGAHSHRIELNLARRDMMGFRMLLGRQALKGRFLVDPARSYVCGRRKPRRSQ